MVTVPKTVPRLVKVVATVAGIVTILVSTLVTVAGTTDVKGKVLGWLGDTATMSKQLQKRRRETTVS